MVLEVQEMLVGIIPVGSARFQSMSPERIAQQV